MVVIDHNPRGGSHQVFSMRKTDGREQTRIAPIRELCEGSAGANCANQGRFGADAAKSNAPAPQRLPAANTLSPLLAAAPDLTLPIRQLARRFSSTQFIGRQRHLGFVQLRLGVL